MSLNRSKGISTFSKKGSVLTHKLVHGEGEGGEKKMILGEMIIIVARNGCLIF